MDADEGGWPVYDSDEAAFVWKLFPVPAPDVCDKRENFLVERTWRGLVLVEPRVILTQCVYQRGPGSVESEFVLTSLDDAGLRWNRPITWFSGTRRIRVSMLNAQPGRILLSTLEVIDPETGEALKAAPAREIPQEQRAIPAVSQVFTGDYDRRTGVYVLFDDDRESPDGGPEGSGLFEADERGRAVALWMPEDARRRAGGTIDHVAFSDDGRFVYAARRANRRGVNWVQLAVYDRERRRLYQSRQYCERQLCREPRVFADPSGKVAFMYKAIDQKKTVLLTFDPASWNAEVGTSGPASGR